MQTPENNKYTYTHQVFVGSPSGWRFDLDDSARYLVAAIGFLGFSFICYGMYHLFSFAEGRSEALIPFLFLLAAGLSVIISVLSGILAIHEMVEYRSLPQFGCRMYRSYNVRMTINRDGLKILLGEDLNSNDYQYFWFCPWECLSGIDFTKNKRLGTITMTAKNLRKDPSPYVRHTGAWHYWDERFGNPLMYDEQKKVFGGRNKIVLHLLEPAADEVIDALNQFSPGHVDAITS